MQNKVNPMPYIKIKMNQIPKLRAKTIKLRKKQGKIFMTLDLGIIFWI